MKKTLLFTALLVLTTIALNAQTPISQTGTAPTIDGTREAVWDDAPKYLAVDPHSWCYDGWIQGWFGREVTMQSASDLSLNWSAMWDATNLYFFFEFTDDVVTTGDTANMGAGEKLWMMDCAEMKIGEYFYRFGYGRDEEIFQRPADGQTNPGGYTQKSVTVTGGYAIEVQIPWSTLNNDSVTLGLNPDVDTTFMVWVSGADLDNPAGTQWNDQDGHIHFPYDGGMEEIVLALTAPVDAIAPAAPANFAATEVTLTSVKLTWDEVADADLMGYVVYLEGVAQKFIHGATEASIALEENNEYTFVVKSYDGQNFSVASEVDVSTIPTAGEILIGQTMTLPVIDGVREAVWNGAPQYVAVDPTTWTPSPDHQSLEDCSFEWSALWDDDSLYLFVSIMDDIPTTGDIVTEGSSAKSWMNDNVEVSIAPIDGAGSAWFFRFGYNREPLDLGLLDDPPKNTPAGSRYVTADQTGGWILEAAIPWKILSTDPDNFTGWAGVDSVINIGVYVADLDIPDATQWDKLSGHVQWPRGWATADVKLASSVLIDNEAPNAPAGLAVADITFNGATLSWDASPEEDVVGYLVLSGDAPKIYTSETSVDLSLSAATEYSFTVIAVDPQNLSEESEPAEFTTTSPPALKSISIPKYTGSYPIPFDDLELWEGLPHQDLTYGLEGVDPADFSVYFKAMWDDDNLYVQISLVDPPPFINGKVNPWENDNTEIHFDLQNAKDGTSCEDVDGVLYQKDNMQYRFICMEPDRQHGSTPAPNWTNLTQVDYELYNEAGTEVIGWYVEITIPWATLNLTADGYYTFEPAIGKAIGVEIHAFDYDADGNAGCIWSSYSNLPPNRNNAEYGEFILGHPLSVFSPETQSLNVYPNPSRGIFAVSLPDTQLDNLSVIDITGRSVLNMSLVDKSGTFNMDLSNMAKGIYYITVENAGVIKSLTKIVLH